MTFINSHVTCWCATSFPGLFSAEERMGGKHPLLGGEKPWERGWLVWALARALVTLDAP